MSQYFFEGDTVRLAYWRIDYDDDRFMYANTDEAKQEIVTALTEQGFAPRASAIDQTGNEWIDGMCFTDHADVDVALAAGCKNFICDGDNEAVLDTLCNMNDTMFHVDAEDVWHITLRGTPTLPCYNLMACITANSVDNQMISINGAAAIPLMKNCTDPVIANDIKATSGNPVAVQINIANGKAYLNFDPSGGWILGELRTFGYKRPQNNSELLCDGSGLDASKYPTLRNLIGNTYGYPDRYTSVENKHGTGNLYLSLIRGNSHGWYFGFPTSSTNLYYASNDLSSWTSKGSASCEYRFLGQVGDTIYIQEKNNNVNKVRLLGVTGSGTVTDIKHTTYMTAFNALGYAADTDTILYAEQPHAYTHNLYKITNGTVTDLGASISGDYLCIEYLPGPKCWLFVKVTSNACQVLKISSLSGTIQPQTLYSVPLTLISKSNLDSIWARRVTANDKVLLPYENELIALDVNGYTMFRTPSDSLGKFIDFVAIDGNHLAVCENGVCTMDINNVVFNMPQIHTTLSTPYSACYDANNKRVIIAASNNTLMLDTSEVALPKPNNTGFLYIKAL